MNSFLLGISGSWWLAVLLIILAVAFSIYTYRKTIPQINSMRKAILITLRSMGLALLLFIIFEPILTMVRSKEEPPKLAVLLDNSLSMGQSDAWGDRKEAVKTAIQNSGFASIDKDKLQVLLFSNDIKTPEGFSLNSLDFKGQQTDISHALHWVSANEEKDNIQAVLLISDGEFNTGSNPIYNAETIGKPIFTIGIGDSSEPADVALESIITNDNVYVNNPVPVNVNVKVTGYNEGQLTLKLFDNGTQIGEQQLNVNPEKQSFTAVFDYSPKQEGIHKLTATISTLKNEITTKNNTISNFVNVLKEKKKITIFAGSVDPDISFLRNTLAEDKGVAVETFIQEKGSEFYDKPPTQADLRESDIIVLVGFPINSTSIQVLQLIKNELDQGKPLLFIASQDLDYNKLKILGDYLPFTTISSKPQEFLAIPDIKPEEASNPLLRITGSESDINLWNQLPPVFATETFVRAKPESEVVAGMKVNNTPLKEPMILMRTFGNKKSVAFLCYGLYRWKLLGYASDVSKGRPNTPDLYDILINNIHRWLSVSPDKKQVSIKTTKKIYTNNESVEFIGQIYDAAFSPIDNAVVKVKIGGGTQERELILNSLGNGRYYGKIEGLPENDYFFTGTAALNERKIGEDKGRFSVGNIALEYQNLRMNSELLRSLSGRTGGKFYLPSQSSSFANDLKNLKNFIPRGITERKEFALWNYLWLLVFALLCFATEWFLRKRAGML